MSDEGKFWLALWIPIASLIVILIIASGVVGSKKDVKMAELGYQEVVVPTGRISIWQKTENK